MNIEIPQDDLLQFVIYLGDNNLILGHRISEWCGHGPVLEQDIALTNISLDLVGQARLYYQYAAELMGEGHTEDTLAYLRSERNYLNALLVERPNGDFGDTIVRQFIYDSFHYYFLNELKQSSDRRLAEIAEKSIKEVAYHKRYSSEWMLRLGDGTEESNSRIQKGLDELWKYGEELVIPAPWEDRLSQKGIAPDLQNIRESISDFRSGICASANVRVPTVEYHQQGGKEKMHSEYLGHILAELQYVQRAYPGQQW